MKSFIFVIALTVCIACASDRSGSAVTPDEIAGMYEGKLPCADCAFIEYTIELDDALGFMDNMDYAGKKANSVTASGAYSISDDGLITLEKPTEGYKYLRKHPEGLLLLDKNGNEITGSTAKLYILHKVEPLAYEPPGETAPTDNVNTGTAADAAGEGEATADSELAESEASRAKASRQLKKWSEGVNFHAIGNEPFWNLDIDFDRGMLFSAMDGIDLSTPMGLPEQNDEGEVRKYTAEVESGTLIVGLDDSGCTDNMSGEQFEYKVTVQVKVGGDSEFSTFAGCGEYLADPNLHGMWVIEEFDGERIADDEFRKGIPQIEIDVRDDVFSGHDGCNQFSGGLQVRMMELTFQSGPTTLMACEDQPISSAITQALVGTPYFYGFSGRRLILSDEGNPRFQLIKIE